VTQLIVDDKGALDNQPPATPFKIMCAMKTNYDIFLFQVPCSFTVLLMPVSERLTPD